MSGALKNIEKQTDHIYNHLDSRTNRNSDVLIKIH